MCAAGGVSGGGRRPGIGLGVAGGGWAVPSAARQGLPGWGWPAAGVAPDFAVTPPDSLFAPGLFASCQPIRPDSLFAGGLFASGSLFAGCQLFCGLQDLLAVLGAAYALGALGLGVEVFGEARQTNVVSGDAAEPGHGVFCLGADGGCGAGAGGCSQNQYGFAFVHLGGDARTPVKQVLVGGGITAVVLGKADDEGVALLNFCQKAVSGFGYSLLIFQVDAVKWQLEIIQIKLLYACLGMGFGKVLANAG